VTGDTAAWTALGSALVLTLKLAALSTLILLLTGTPLAWWLARGHSVARRVVAAVVALPLVLPPTVLGFYLLIGLGPQSLIGHWTQALGLGLLPFTFGGVLLGSVLYSLPFVVQPLQAAFAAVPASQLEAAATLRARPLDAFWHVALPQARAGYRLAAVLGFCHTVGEFGVVLMLGGNIEGRTRVLSILLYDQVEAMQFAPAHALAAGLLGFSFLTLLWLYGSRGANAGAQP
jgi:molybdate transport system permease protein